MDVFFFAITIICKLNVYISTTLLRFMYITISWKIKRILGQKNQPFVKLHFFFYRLILSHGLCVSMACVCIQGFRQTSNYCSYSNNCQGKGTVCREFKRLRRMISLCWVFVGYSLCHIKYSRQ